MTNIFNRAIIFGIILGMIALTAMLMTRVTSGSAPSGLPATVATTTNQTMTAGTARVLFATSTCASRIISTGASAVMLTFSDYNNASPTGSFGHLQSASTTVAYDSGQYGCGLVKGYSYTAQVITVSESR